MILTTLLLALQAGPVVHQEEFGQFLSKLGALRKDPSGQLRVYQIGDSHLQAGFFGGKLRERFQGLFGSAGRGLIFPYRSAGSNGAPNLRWGTRSAWAVSNAIRKENAFPWGLSGWSMQSLGDTAELDFRLAPTDGAVDSFAQVTVLGDFQGASIVDTSGHPWQAIDSSRASLTVAMPVRQNRFTVVLRGQGARLDGLVLQSARSGLLWSDVGVNGMAWSDLLKPTALWRQLDGLAPDLVVISLGTNDAWYAKYEEAAFRDHVKEVLRRIRLVVPQANVLLTLPPDHALTVSRRKTASNPRLTSVIGVLRETCEQGQATCVDLQELMGGEGSWKEWTAQGLMAKDHVHYAKAGYARQAELVADALLALPAHDPVRTASAKTRESLDFLASQDSLLASYPWIQPVLLEARKVEPKAERKVEAKKKLAKTTKARKTTKDRKVPKKIAKKKSKPRYVKKGTRH